jgi:AcrR family transcriptional regulator
VSRTPSAAAHQKVIDAAIQLIGERGIEGTSMDAIAQVSGVSKATVYKHWKDKEALCLDVIGSVRQLPPEFRSGDTYRDLVDFLTFLSKADKPDRLMKIWPRVIGHAVANRKFAAALQEHSFSPRRAQIGRILKEAAERGDLPADIDVNLAMDLLVGPIMHRRFTGGQCPPGFTEQVVMAFLRGQAQTGTNNREIPAVYWTQR